MILLLDTNAISAVLSGTSQVARRLARYRPSDVAISGIANFEFQFGILKSARVEENQRRFDQLGLQVIPFDKEDALAAATIRLALERAGTPIGPYDTLIAGQAIARDLTLITRNTREFSRVEGLRFENWEA